MENKVNSNAWLDIINQNPQWCKNYQVSVNDSFDCLVDEYTQLVKGREKLSDGEATDILFDLARTNEASKLLNEGETLHVQGHGMYYAMQADSVEFVDGTTGVSGYFAGLQIDDLPLYHELIYKNKALYRPLLCIALEGYALHNDDNTPGIFVDDTIIVPVVGQDLCINRYSEISA